MLNIPGKIPITIHPLFWLIAFFIGWMWTFTLTGALLCIGIILISVLFHEFGHALTSLAFGQEARIELAAFGGFTYRQGRKLKLWEEFLVVLNGPVAGLLLAFIAYLIFKNVPLSNPSIAFMVKFTMVANLFWTVINLVPVLPLDGGHLLSIVLEGIFGFKGVKIAIIIGLVIAICISIFFFIIGQFLVGALFLILTFESFRSLRYYKIFTEKDRDQDLQKLMQDADKDVDEERYDAALAKLQAIRNKTAGGILHTMATQEMAEVYKQKGEFEKGYDVLKPIRKNIMGDGLPLLHYLAYMNHDYSLVVDLSAECYQIAPSFQTAFLNSLSYAALGKPAPAIGWLGCSVRDGLPNPEEAIKRKEFDKIRLDPEFKDFASKI